MIEIPLSMIAWISVVLIQAIVHYVVFGVRRERIQQEEEALFETLSLSTSESFAEHEATDLSSSLDHHLGVVDRSASPSRRSSSSFPHHDEYTILRTTAPDVLHSPTSSRSTLSFDKNLIIDPPSFSLMQTGSDIIKVRLIWVDRVHSFQYLLLIVRLTHSFIPLLLFLI
jgi:hypothetical protein